MWGSSIKPKINQGKSPLALALDHIIKQAAILQATLHKKETSVPNRTITITGGSIPQLAQDILNWIANLVPELPDTGRVHEYAQTDLATGMTRNVTEIVFNYENGNVLGLDLGLMQAFSHIAYADAAETAGRFDSPFHMYSPAPSPDAPKPAIVLFGARTPDNDARFNGKVTYSVASNFWMADHKFGEEQVGPGGMTFVLRQTVGMFGGGPCWVGK